MSSSQSNAPNPMYKPDYKIWFNLKSTLSERFVGEIPGGFRIDIEYNDQAKAVTLSGGSSLNADKRGKSLDGATLLSGSDWLFLSQEGVASFDSRITLGVPQGDPKVLIAGRLRGRANFARAVEKGSGGAVFAGDLDENGNVPGATVIGGWQSGRLSNAWVPLGLAVVFDVPLRGASPQDDDLLRELRVLETSLVVGVGKALFGGAAAGGRAVLSGIDIDFYQVGLK